MRKARRAALRHNDMFYLENINTNDLLSIYVKMCNEITRTSSSVAATNCHDYHSFIAASVNSDKYNMYMNNINILHCPVVLAQVVKEVNWVAHVMKGALVTMSMSRDVLIYSV